MEIPSSDVFAFGLLGSGNNTATFARLVLLEFFSVFLESMVLAWFDAFGAYAGSIRQPARSHEGRDHVLFCVLLRR